MPIRNLLLASVKLAPEALSDAEVSDAIGELTTNEDGSQNNNISDILQRMSVESLKLIIKNTKDNVEEGAILAISSIVNKNGDNVSSKEVKAVAESSLKLSEKAREKLLGVKSVDVLRAALDIIDEGKLGDVKKQTVIALIEKKSLGPISRTSLTNRYCNILAEEVEKAIGAIETEKEEDIKDYQSRKKSVLNKSKGECSLKMSQLNSKLTRLTGDINKGKEELERKKAEAAAAEKKTSDAEKSAEDAKRTVAQAVKNLSESLGIGLCADAETGLLEEGGLDAARAAASTLQGKEKILDIIETVEAAEEALRLATEKASALNSLLEECKRGKLLVLKRLATDGFERARTTQRLNCCSKYLETTMRMIEEGSGSEEGLDLDAATSDLELLEKDTELVVKDLRLSPTSDSVSVEELEDLASRRKIEKICPECAGAIERVRDSRFMQHTAQTCPPAVVKACDERRERGDKTPYKKMLSQQMFIHSLMKYSKEHANSLSQVLTAEGLVEACRKTITSLCETHSLALGSLQKTMCGDLRSADISMTLFLGGAESNQVHLNDAVDSLRAVSLTKLPVAAVVASNYIFLCECGALISGNEKDAEAFSSTANALVQSTLAPLAAAAKTLQNNLNRLMGKENTASCDPSAFDRDDNKDDSSEESDDSSAEEGTAIFRDVRGAERGSAGAARRRTIEDMADCTDSDDSSSEEEGPAHALVGEAGTRDSVVGVREDRHVWDIINAVLSAIALPATGLFQLVRRGLSLLGVGDAVDFWFYLFERGQ